MNTFITQHHGGLFYNILFQAWYLPFLKVFSLPTYSSGNTNSFVLLCLTGFWVLHFLVLLGTISIGRYVLKIHGIIVVGFITLLKDSILPLYSLYNISYCLLL